MSYGDFKDLARRIASDKVLRNKAFNIEKNLKYDGYQRGFASMVNNFLMEIQKEVVSLITIIMMNKIWNYTIRNYTN